MCAICAAPVEVSGSLSLASDGMSKGASESGERAQAVADIAISKGFLRIGGKLKNVDSNLGAEYQTDLYAGVEGALGGFDLDFTVARKTKQKASGDKGYTEFKLEASREFGLYELVSELEFTPDNSGAGKQSWWGEVSLAREITEQWSISAGIGGRRLNPENDYAAWNAGVIWRPAENTRLELRGYDTDSDQPEREGRIVASIRQDF